MEAYRKKVFPLLAGVLWAAFLFLDLTGLADSTWVKFAAICLCCLTALPGAGTADGRLVAAALCFTVGADWFLLVRNDNYELGIGLFIIVQLLYACRLYRLRGKRLCRWGLILRLLVLFLALLSAAPALLALPFVYFSNLLINTFEAFALNRRVFAVGLLLFVCCDICVGAYNLGLLPALTFPGMWFFYLPSQVLIVLSRETGT